MREMPEPVVVVEEGEQFALFSCADGATYVLRSKEDSAAAFLEGDDLPAFLQEYESTKEQYPTYSADQILAQLWDQGGYSWSAISDDEE